MGLSSKKEVTMRTSGHINRLIYDGLYQADWSQIYLIRLVFLGLSVGLLLSTLGCAAAEIIPKANPAIRGSVTNRNPATGEGGLLGSILVEGNVENDTQFDKASIAITSETKIFEQVARERRPATFEALQVGQRVEAWFTGPVAESYPVQAVASDVVILK